MSGGRPSNYTLELAKRICNVIATSSKGISKLCKENPDFPSHETIFSWIKDNEEFSDLYARAKRYQITTLIDEIVDIADETSNDYSLNEKGKLVVDHENISRSKLRIDTRKWLASKLLPKLYGDKITVESDNKDAEEIKKVRELISKCTQEADSN